MYNDGQKEEQNGKYERHFLQNGFMFNKSDKQKIYIYHGLRYHYDEKAINVYKYHLSELQWWTEKIL